MSTKETKPNNPLLRVILAGVAVILLCGVLCGAAGASESVEEAVLDYSSRQGVRYAEPDYYYSVPVMELSEEKRT